MLISYEWVFGISATAFARRVDGFRSADTTNTWFGYFLATATYPASDPARGEIGFSGPGRLTAAGSASPSVRLGVPFAGRASVTTTRGGCLRSASSCAVSAGVDASLRLGGTACLSRPL